MAISDLRTDWLEQARKVALALPEAAEQETWGHPTFRVRGKIFAGMGVSDDGIDFVPREVEGPDVTESVTTISMKAAPGEHESLLATGYPFFKPKYVGSKGWIGIVIHDETDWTEVQELMIDSYRAIAPKKLVKLLDAST